MALSILEKELVDLFKAHEMTDDQVIRIILFLRKPSQQRTMKKWIEKNTEVTIDEIIEEAVRLQQEVIVDIEWDFVHPIKSVGLIDEFEQLAGYHFCEAFRKCVFEYNAGYPSKYVYDTKKTKERVFDCLLSFNREDKSNIWSYLDSWDEPAKHLAEKYIVFSDDPFGNWICFDKTNDKVVFIDHETLMVEEVADSFDEFIDGLYEDED